MVIEWAAPSMVGSAPVGRDSPAGMREAVYFLHRMVVCLGVLLCAASLLYVFGNFSHFLDKSQFIILRSCVGCSVLLVVACLCAGSVELYFFLTRSDAPYGRLLCITVVALLFGMGALVFNTVVLIVAKGT